MPGRLQLQNSLALTYNRAIFVKEVLRPVFLERLTAYSSSLPQSNLTDSERRLLRSVDAYGDLQLEDGTVVRCFEIQLQPKVSVEHSRVGIQHYVRKLLIAGQAVLINFIPTKTDGHIDDSRPWRLTLVAKDTALVDGHIENRPTNPKRYTYLLGHGQACRTAAERFETLFKQPRLDFTTLIQAFEVEALSKEFFKEYRRHYYAFIDYLNKSAFRASVFNGDEKAIRDWTKKLLGRIVFLYFVQKKGWLGARTTDYADGNTHFNTNFLTELFLQSGGDETFYPNWLSKLFFGTLNKLRPGDDFIMPDQSRVKVPFLNGGLFDRDVPDRKGPITFPASLFHHEQNPDNPVHRGFLDFLNSYNFTVHEDSPDDHVVAVDPEMLGNIFENLLEDNKDKGAFYTPKAIVHYMCRESLIEYLNTSFQGKGIEQRAELEDFVLHKHPNAFVNSYAGEISQLLDVVRICDPAIGSGAFPMGLLHEIFQCKLALMEITQAQASLTAQDSFPAQVKLNIIQNSIYGVDVEQGAVDIARLRFWLSLVVDEAQPRALPNLDYKIVVGNSLVSKLGNETLMVDWTLRGSITAEEDFIRLAKQLSVKQREFFMASGNKDALQQEIRNLKIDLLLAQIDLDRKKVISVMPGKGLFELSAKELKRQVELQEQLQGLDATIQQLKVLRNNTAQSLPYFDWRLDFPEVLNPHVSTSVGFDIVIGNPPYVQIQKLDEGTKTALERQQYETYTRMGDLYQLFYEVGMNMLKPGGHLCYITSNKWMRTEYGQRTRAYFGKRYHTKQVVDFGMALVFETATTLTNILLVEKKEAASHLTMCRINEDYTPQNSLQAYVLANQISVDNPGENSWIAYNKSELALIKRIEAQGIALKDWNIKINRGILTGYNPAFIIDTERRNQLIAEDPRSAEIIQPLLRGEDIKAYVPQWAGLWLINTFPSLHLCIDDYPAIKKHLSTFKVRLEPKPRSYKGNEWSGRKAGSYKWFETQDSINYYQEFSKPKIIYPNMTKYMPFVYDKDRFFTNQKCFIITGEDLGYLTAFFNSRIFRFAFKEYFPELLGDTRELSKVFFENVTVKPAGINISKTFTDLVEKIQELKLKHLPSDSLEEDIETLLADIYGLSKSEREILVGQSINSEQKPE